MAKTITWVEDNSPAGIFEVEGKLLSTDGHIATVKDGDENILTIKIADILCDDDCVEAQAYGETHFPVCWPESQNFMDHPEFQEKAMLIGSHSGYAIYGDSAYFIPNEWAGWMPTWAFAAS